MSENHSNQSLLNSVWTPPYFNKNNFTTISLKITILNWTSDWTQSCFSALLHNDTLHCTTKQIVTNLVLYIPVIIQN